ncbi:hypothetical protein HAX54_038979 [Datura stramonium]|uniref:Post-GPI attachment to proteins factor 3 n=1 Tax=Datura stramonium TaxID=4076 RepID=A0ABS8SJM1_DATST|nr:hypothetical protein [Datura stramonium]
MLCSTSCRIFEICWFYRACVDQCEKTEEQLYLRWKQWDCLSDCSYHCMLAEEERKKVGLKRVNIFKMAFSDVSMESRNLFL